METESQLELVEKEFKKELQVNQKALKALLETTFKNFTPELMQKSIYEGLLRGFLFRDFLDKSVYAIKYGEGYSLVTSIDRARKIGMKSNVVGTTEPIYEEKDGEIVACSVTIKRKFNEYIGDFTAKPYFKEYFKEGKTYNGKKTPSMWDKMPRTMIAKVAEMAALRKACPEELSQSYVEEEMQQEVLSGEVLDDKYKSEIAKLKTVEEVKAYHKINAGQGKEFDKAIIEKVKELEVSKGIKELNENL